VAWRLGFLPDEGAHQLPRPLRFIGPSTWQRSAQTAARPHRRPEHDATLPGRRRHHQTTRVPQKMRPAERAKTTIASQRRSARTAQQETGPPASVRRPVAFPRAPLLECSVTVAPHGNSSKSRGGRQAGSTPSASLLRPPDRSRRRRAEENPKPQPPHSTRVSSLPHPPPS